MYICIHTILTHTCICFAEQCLRNHRPRNSPHLQQNRHWALRLSLLRLLVLRLSVLPFLTEMSPSGVWVRQCTRVRVYVCFSHSFCLSLVARTQLCRSNTTVLNLYILEWVTFSHFETIEIIEFHAWFDICNCSQNTRTHTRTRTHMHTFAPVL